MKPIFEQLPIEVDMDDVTRFFKSYLINPGEKLEFQQLAYVKVQNIYDDNWSWPDKELGVWYKAYDSYCVPSMIFKRTYKNGVFERWASIIGSPFRQYRIASGDSHIALLIEVDAKIPSPLDIIKHRILIHAHSTGKL